MLPMLRLLIYIHVVGIHWSNIGLHVILQHQLAGYQLHFNDSAFITFDDHNDFLHPLNMLKRLIKGTPWDETFSMLSILKI